MNEHEKRDEIGEVKMRYLSQIQQTKRIETQRIGQNNHKHPQETENENL